MTEPVRVIASADLTESDPTPGMRRQKAFEAPGLWAGVVHTEPGAKVVMPTTSWQVFAPSAWMNWKIERSFEVS